MAFALIRLRPDTMKLRLQTKYTLAITGLILSVFGIVAFTHNWQFHRGAAEKAAMSLREFDEQLARRLADEGRRLANALSRDLGALLAAGDGDRIQRRLAMAVVYSGNAIAHVVVTDRQGRTYRAQRPGATPDAEMPRGLDIEVPIFHRGEVVGSVGMGLSLAPLTAMHDEMEAALLVAQGAEQEEGKYLAAVLLLLALGGVLLAGITARRLTRPTRALARAARALADGNLNTPLPTTRGHDEIDELTIAFEGMRESLARTTVSRDFLYRIIDSLNEGLMVTDASGAIRLTNRAVSEMFGYSPDQLTGVSFTTLLREPHQCASRTGKLMECHLLHRNGHAIPVEVSRSVFSENEDTEQVYVISDITARKQMEDELGTYRSRLEQLVVERTKELTAAVQELESFSYSVSHDLHAPLRAINGFGAALYEDYYPHMDDTCRGYLDRMRLATVRMGHLIDGLLTLTRVARSEICHETVDLSALASEIASDIASSDPPRQATFRIAPKVVVQSDPHHMRLLLQNLFANAWKFTRDQENVVIEFGKGVLEGTRVYFVRDNGTGFDPSCANGLFRPFHRLHGDDIPGTGIGLATVQRIVQRHGGQVWAEAAPGAGATFFFTLEGRSNVHQVDDRRVSSRDPESNNISSQRPSATA